MSQYPKACVYCKQQIRMSDESGSWKAYDLNNGLHDCRKKQEPTTQKQTNGNGKNNNDLSLELVLKKLESIGITLDLQKLRNV